MTKQIIPNKRRQFLESILKREVKADETEQYEKILKAIGDVGNLFQKGAEYLQRNPHSRRTFLKAAVVGSGLLAAGCAGLPVFESREDIAKIKWDSNPAIPVPTSGCYVGWHYDISPLTVGIYRRLFRKLDSSDEEILITKHYEKDYGQGPAVHSFSDRLVGDDFFPKQICEGAYNKGVIPLVRYYFFPDFKRVARGDYDNLLVKFAQGARDFGKPFFFVPYPEANIVSRFKYVHPWAGSGGKGFKEAWKHMHNIFDGEGANDYAVWGLHLIGLYVGQRFSRFAVDNDLVDWVGFTVYNLVEQSGGLDRSFYELIGQQNVYGWAKSHYPEKPFALWEFGTSDTTSQGIWIKNAYERIKNMPRIKLVVYAEYPMFTPFDCTVISDEAKPYYKEAISDPYFIGSKKVG